MKLVGPLNGMELAALPDAELAEYLKKCGYDEAGRAAMAAEVNAAK